MLQTDQTIEVGGQPARILQTVAAFLGTAAVVEVGGETFWHALPSRTRPAPLSPLQFRLLSGNNAQWAQAYRSLLRSPEIVRMNTLGTELAQAGRWKAALALWRIGRDEPTWLVDFVLARRAEAWTHFGTPIRALAELSFGRVDDTWIAWAAGRAYYALGDRVAAARWFHRAAFLRETVCNGAELEHEPLAEPVLRELNASEQERLHATPEFQACAAHLPIDDFLDDAAVKQWRPRFPRHLSASEAGA